MKATDITAEAQRTPSRPSPKNLLPQKAQQTQKQTATDGYNRSTQSPQEA